MRKFLILIAIVTLSGCAMQIPLPGSLGDPSNANDYYGYRPLDPLPVELTVPNEQVLAVLPDETIRIAVGTFSMDGGITYGPAIVGVEGNNYVVVLDYIKYGTDSLPVQIVKDNQGNRIAKLVEVNNDVQIDAVVPVYIGIGLRLTANIRVNKGKINLGSLFALGAAAKAEKLSGTMVIQTLGISGPEISGLIPMPGEISESTIQNAILSLASIKAKIYDSKTEKSPRVVAVYNNLGGNIETINGFISSLLVYPIEFPK
jgi:hypothetical protein